MSLCNYPSFSLPNPPDLLAALLALLPPLPSYPSIPWPALVCPLD